MKLYRPLMLATALATGLAVAIPLSVHAQEKAKDGFTLQTNPGFNPNTGQINPGGTSATPSSSIDIRKIPSHAEAIAALMAPSDPNSAPGADAPQQASSTPNKPVSPQSATGSGDPTTATQGHAAIGGPLSPGASAGGANNASSSGGGNAPGTATAETTGVRPASTANANRPGPIGATGQTMPAKFSERNNTLDRLPTMAWPLRLTNEERQRIYQAVSADKSQPASGADALGPASELSTDQALNQTHAMPDSLKDIDQLKRLTYLKAKDKVLLVEPSTRVVVDEISSKS